MTDRKQHVIDRLNSASLKIMEQKLEVNKLREENKQLLKEIEEGDELRVYMSKEWSECVEKNKKLRKALDAKIRDTCACTLNETQDQIIEYCALHGVLHQTLKKISALKGEKSAHGVEECFFYAIEIADKALQEVDSHD